MNTMATRRTLVELIREQQNFIAGARYTGYEDNEAVRAADLDYLHRLEGAQAIGHKHLPSDFFTRPDKYRRMGAAARG